MPKIRYQSIKIQQAGLDIIEIANEIIDDYASQGYDLTLRQLYYQFVAQDRFPESWFNVEENTYNCEKNYKRLGSILNNGRLAGLVDWSKMVDRTRNLHELGHYENPGDFIAKVVNWFNRDLWATQKVRTEVWIEKSDERGYLQKVADNWEDVVAYLD